MSKIYVALDLETTGFDPNNDQVIEIAAIKFSGNQILDRYETLINPEVEIPQMVSHITGISSETIATAPTFPQIKDDLIKFIGNYPIVGHNIDFDLTFLKAKGIPILNKEFDTLQLSSILLDHLPSYSLDTISRLLKINHLQKHRAMSDAHVCFELFNLLLDKIAELPSGTLTEIQQLQSRCQWDLGELFFLKNKADKNSKKIKDQKTKEKQNNLNLEPKNTEELQEILNSNSILKDLLPEFEYRAGQSLLLQKINDAFNHNFHLIAEAGTGTGKTLAYLLAAAFQSKKNGQPLIISTYTNNLQDQIINKDAPLVQQIFPDLKLATLKGKKKYLSKERFKALKNKATLEPFELTTIIKTLIWLNKTETGDLDELHLQNKEIILLDEICADQQSRPLKSSEPDFLELAREKAQSANIVIINHSLLIQDILAENKILPEHHYLIIDEAHHLEKTTTDALSTIFTFNRFLKPIEHIIDILDLTQETLLPQQENLTQLRQAWRTFRLNLENQLEKLFHQVRLFLENFAKTQPGNTTLCSLNIALQNSLEWQNITANLRDLKNLKNDLIKNIQNTNTIEEQHELELDLDNQIDNLSTLFQDCLDLPDQIKEKIIWMQKNFDESLQLCTAPLSVKETLQQRLFQQKKSIILTSATLSTYGNFNYLRAELGLGEDFNEVKINSHFSYPEQVKIIIPENLPEPRDPEYLNCCNKIIEATILANQGKTLTLFTAKKELAKTFHDLASKLKLHGISLLGQGISGGKGKIVSHFQDEPDKSAILGTNSFWEGVDLAGNQLTCVIIQKLPFDPPDDPIIHARSQKFSKPFEEYALPRAILRFKQGFGRLIRTSKDTGSVIILDSRLVQKTYGKNFLSSLPTDIQVIQCQDSEVASKL